MVHWFTLEFYKNADIFFLFPSFPPPRFIGVPLSQCPFDQVLWCPSVSMTHSYGWDGETHRGGKRNTQVGGGWTNAHSLGRADTHTHRCSYRGGAQLKRGISKCCRVFFTTHLIWNLEQLFLFHLKIEIHMFSQSTQPILTNISMLSQRFFKYSI